MGLHQQIAPSMRMYGVTDRAFCVESLIFSSLHPNDQLLIALKSSSRVLHIPGLAQTRIDVSELLFCRTHENAVVSQFLVSGPLTVPATRQQFNIVLMAIGSH